MDTENLLKSLKDFILTTGLKELIVNYYHYVTDGVLEESREPHVYSKEEAEKFVCGMFELNSFGSFVEWWNCFTRNHNATCEYMTCTAVLENGHRFLIHEHKKIEAPKEKEITMADTAALMISDDWKERLIAEYIQLENRIRSLDSYLSLYEESMCFNYAENKPFKPRLHVCDLYEQRGIMAAYRMILVKRMIVSGLKDFVNTSFDNFGMKNNITIIDK